MKSVQIVVHTQGGIVRSAPDQLTERDYEALKEMLQESSDGRYLSFNTDDGWVLIPYSQIYYVEVVLQ